MAAIDELPEGKVNTTTEEEEGDNLEEENVRLKFKFEVEECTVDDFDNDKNLPDVVQFKDTTGEITPGLKIYANIPVLFYKRISKIQASARTIYRDKDGAYFEVGQTILIPADYQGWFEIVPNDFRRASCYKSIEQLAADMPKRFFTRSNIKALRVVTTDTGEEQYLERKIPAGSVVTTDSIFTAKWMNEAQTGLFKKKNTQVTYEVKYLKCITSSDAKEVLIPLSHVGKFNGLYERGKLDGGNAVYTMQDVLSDLSLPTRVRLLYGKAPVVPCIFTGMLNIKSTKLEESIICSTIAHKRNVLFEMPAKTNCSVNVANNTESCCHLVSYKDGMRLCEKYSDVYSTMMKLSPKMDTNQQVMQHIPTDPSYMRHVDDALKALDLVTDMSLTDEPRDILMEDSDSMGSVDKSSFPTGIMMELTKDSMDSTA